MTTIYKGSTLSMLGKTKRSDKDSLMRMARFLPRGAEPTLLDSLGSFFMADARLTITVQGDKITIEIHSGNLTVKPQVVQETFFPDQTSLQPTPQQESNEPKPLTEPMIYTLTHAGYYHEGMEFEEARKLIGKLKSGELQPIASNPEPLPWEEKKKRSVGRPKKVV